MSNEKWIAETFILIIAMALLINTTIPASVLYQSLFVTTFIGIWELKEVLSQGKQYFEKIRNEAFGYAARYVLVSYYSL